MAPLFSQVDSNKLWHDVQNEETVISGKNLFNISKVIGRKTKWPRFFRPTRYLLILSIETLQTCISEVQHCAEMCVTLFLLFKVI